jgi:hypothetical protein
MLGGRTATDAASVDPVIGTTHLCLRILRMRAFDRDPIREGHYGQRSSAPHPKAEHMAAPTNTAEEK